MTLYTFTISKAHLPPLLPADAPHATDWCIQVLCTNRLSTVQKSQNSVLQYCNSPPQVNFNNLTFLLNCNTACTNM